MSSAGAETAVPSSDNLSFFRRVLGVVGRPRTTFETVVREPRAAGMLTALFLVPFACSALFFATEVGQQALVDQWERTAVAFGQPMDNERYARLQELSAQTVSYAAATAFVSGPLTAIGLAAVLWAVFTGVRGGNATYAQVIAVVAHAGVIQMVRALVSAPVNYARESMASPTTLVLFFTMVDEASPVARFFGLIDVFIVWWLVAIAIGMAVLYRRPAARIAALLVGGYIGIALLLAGTMAMLGGTT